MSLQRVFPAALIILNTRAKIQNCVHVVHIKLSEYPRCVSQVERAHVSDFLETRVAT